MVGRVWPEVICLFLLATSSVCLADDDVPEEDVPKEEVPKEYVQVKTDKGTLNGLKVKGDIDYTSFRGIKYAQSPVGSLRFKDPVEVEVETEEIDATTNGYACPQIGISDNRVMGDEDCLWLNVYTTNTSGKQAVVVYLHGGAFVVNTAANYVYNPEYLLRHNLVVVTVNFRLGPFGFLATSDKTASGNFALKDQIMALKWVKRNIAAFGGDPNSVTLMGEDSGASMVSLHMLSPESTGLFHRAVALSGNAVCDQFFQPEPQKAAEELANELGCTSVKGEDIVRCMAGITMQEITKAARELNMLYSFPRLFAPSVDGKVVTDLPEALLSRGEIANKVPLMSGFPKDAGALFYRPIINVFAVTKEGYDDTFVDHKLPRILPVISQIKSKLYPLTRQIKKKYFLNVDMSDEDAFRPRFVNFLTDLLFGACTAKFHRLAEKSGVPVYAYSFDYRGQFSLPNLMGEANDLGVSLSDDVQYLFNIYDGHLEMSTADLSFSANTYLPLIANFAKNSKPTSESDSVSWTPFESGKNNVMSIGTQLTMVENFKQDKLKFWEEDVTKLFSAKKPVTKKKDKDEL